MILRTLYIYQAKKKKKQKGGSSILEGAIIRINAVHRTLIR